MDDTAAISVRTATRDALAAERRESVDDLVQQGIALILRQADADGQRAPGDTATRRTFGTMRFVSPNDFDAPLPEGELREKE